MGWFKKLFNINQTPYVPTSQLWDKLGGQAGSLDYLDEYGYTKKGLLPDGRIAPQVQYDSNRQVMRRNTRLTGEALGTLNQGLQNLQTYRPGGAAALMSPYYQSMAQTILSDKTDFTDQLHYARQDQAMNAQKEARRAGYMNLAGSLLGAAGTAIGGIAGGGGALAAGINAAGNVGAAALMRNPGSAGGEGYQPNQGDSPYSRTPRGGQPEAGGWVPVPEGAGQQPAGGPTSPGPMGMPGQPGGGDKGNGYGNWGGPGVQQVTGSVGGPGAPSGPPSPGPQGVGPQGGGPQGAGGGVPGPQGGPQGPGGGAPAPSGMGGGPDLGAIGYTNEGHAATFASEMGLSSGQVVGLIRMVEGADGDEFWDSMHGRLEALMAG